MQQDFPVLVIRGVAVGTTALVGLAALVTFFAPVAYTTTNTTDAIFLLGVAWRFYEGLVPGADFGHFYGGLTEQVISWAMSLFGPSAKALDQGIVLIWVALTAATAALSWQRLGRTGFWLLLAVISATILSRAVIDNTPALLSSTATYGSLYNRAGSAWAALVVLFCLLPSRGVLPERLGGAIAGSALVILMLTKPTFSVMLPAALVALALQRRWQGLFAALAGGLVLLLILDPRLARFLGSIDYIRAIGVDGGGLGSLILKAVRLLAIQPLALLASLLVFATAIWREPRVSAGWALGAVLVIGAATAMSSTMASPTNYGQQMLPIMATFLIAVACRFGRNEPGALLGQGASAAAALALVTSVAYAGPLLVNSLVAGTQAWANRGQVLVAEGPMASYLALSDFRILDPASGRPEPLEALVERAARRMSEGDERDNGIGYVAFADGLEALRRIGAAGQTTVVSEKYDFNFATGVMPVADFPTYVRETAPELVVRRPFSEQVGVVMLQRHEARTDSTRPLFALRMDGAFTPCETTPIWELHVRTTLLDGFSCTRAEPPMVSQ